MIRTLILCLITLVSVSDAFGQLQIGNLRLESVSSQYGYTTYYLRPSDLNDFQRISPDSYITTGNYDSFKLQSNYPFRQNGIIRANAIIANKNWRDNCYLIRTSLNVGFRKFKLHTHEIGYSKEITSDPEYFTNPNSGETIRLEKTTTNTANFQIENKLNLIELGLFFNTNHDKRWSVFSGFNFLIGAQRTRGRYSLSNFTEQKSYSSSGESTTTFGITNYYHEHPDSRFGFTYGFSLPIGIQMRVSRSHPFLGRWRIIFQKEFSMINYQLPNSDRITKDFRTTMLGFKFDL